MTDRKILELTARAIGINLDQSTYMNDSAGFCWFEGNSVIYWNPLVSIEDCLAVAEKLEMNISFQGKCVSVAHNKVCLIYSTWNKNNIGSEAYQSTFQNAVVHVASEIGKRI